MNSCFEKPRRGRPLNSVTTVPVKLIDLLGYVNPQAKVVVGKKWLESIGVLDKCSRKQQVEPELQFENLAV